MGGPVEEFRDNIVILLSFNTFDVPTLCLLGNDFKPYGFFSEYGFGDG